LSTDGTRTWVEGLPRAEGYFWLLKEDQGGWPSLSMVRTKLLPRNWKEVHDALSALPRPTKEQRNEILAAQQEKVLFVVDAIDLGRGTEPFPVSELWKVAGHIQIQEPPTSMRPESPG
jgi:hypothetical protein